MLAQGLASGAKLGVKGIQKLVKKLKKSIDDKDTSIPGRKTGSISVGKIRQKRAKNKEKTIAGGSAAAGATGASIGIEDVMEFIAPGTSVQKEARSSDNVSSKMKNTVRDIQGTPAELAADKKRAASKTVKVSEPERKPKRNPEASSEDYTGDIKEFLRIKKSKGGKVSMGRGMGKALRGGGKVVR
jgi:hypothetical protein